jgi:hypothetical protein
MPVCQSNTDAEGDAARSAAFRGDFACVPGVEIERGRNSLACAALRS